MNQQVEAILEAVSIIRKFPYDDRVRREQLVIIEENALELGELME